MGTEKHSVLHIFEKVLGEPDTWNEILQEASLQDLRDPNWVAERQRQEKLTKAA